ncbi:Lrp/AsnC family transcriptional regulator [Desulfobacter postgatei]|uniref:Transcriptional regulator n=1 Tax=Desulfobacter postgatei 2ac9 TaxID=879212 RepID=I5AZG3_9BACT|nr:Lrp/AsnC family transcriptional regulator [Desulfobacter postgatei]EIM62626.1 transcriptional regulator [Desulfobacter postgatei 2ac9]
MDKIDLEILKILQKKARIPNVEVSRAIGMAPSAVLERIKKLEAKKIIQGYEVRLNPDMFGCAMTAFVSIEVTRASKIRETGELLAAIEQVQEVHYLAGGDILMIKVKASGNMELEELIQTRIADVSSVRATKTFIALSTFKESAKIKLPDDV